ncbi:MAG: hypothetical protein AAGJ12_07895 [Bacteroidota bacterium]
MMVSLCVGCLPKPPAYPFQDPEKLTVEAAQLSDSLAEYIQQWHRGEVSDTLLASLLPKGHNTERYKHIRLVKPESLQKEAQWVVRPAHDIDFNKLYGSFPDPHCTYVVSPVMYAPFGAELHIKGEFPYCRFFDIQVPPSFTATEYRYDGWSGKGEVAIVDVDIDPVKGHVNPFRVGADRMAKNRSYEVVYQMAIGNPAILNKAHNPPYRGPGNLRYGSAIQLQGPWGLDEKNGHGRGIWDFGDVWIRYFGVDKDKMPDAGVPLPEMYFQLATGEKFYMIADLETFIQESESTMPNRNKGNNDPAAYNGPEVGWDKQYGIFLSISQGLAKALGKKSDEDKAYLRALDLSVNGRAANQPKPASYEPHATGCNYTGYLLAGMSIKKGKVFVLSGKLPTFPDTRNQGKTMKAAQCRYWSITTYDAAFPFSKVKGLENTSIMDDEIVLNENREFIIVYSRAEDRPANATRENGITWVDWGHTDTQAITLRWISVAPEWSFPYAPNELHLPWSTATWSGENYNVQLIGKNRPGFLKEYHPVKHYMTKTVFEGLGQNISKNTLPEWRTITGTN